MEGYAFEYSWSVHSQPTRQMFTVPSQSNIHEHRYCVYIFRDKIMTSQEAVILYKIGLGALPKAKCYIHNNEAIIIIIVRCY